MSVIPKINVGISKKKYRHNKSFDSQSTCNFGEVYPSLCREVIPQETTTINVKSLVRLASMPRPTFGRMSLRNYITFNKYSDLWHPFDNFIAQKPYSVGGVDTTFTECPSFKYSDIQQFILNYSVISFSRNASEPLTIDTTSDTTFNSSRSALWTPYSHLFGSSSSPDGLKFTPSSSSVQYVDRDYVDGSIGLSDSAYDPYNPLSYGGLYTGNNIIIPFGLFWNSNAASLPTTLASYLACQIPNNDESCIAPSRENADLILDGAQIGLSNYTIYVKFKPILKHLRKIFIGLGYQFNPFNEIQSHNLFKLVAFYKSWFELFRPQRSLQYTSTSCYKMMKFYETSLDTSYNTYFREFIYELAHDTYYYFPADYFSMSLDSLGDNSDLSNEINIPQNGDMTSFTQGRVVSDSNQVSISTGSAWPLVQKVAARLLQFTNKNNIIGRNIRDYLRVHYGITDEILDVNGVYKVGNNRINIDTYDVISQSETDLAYLGEYAGRGIGSGSSDSFKFDSDTFGCITCLTCIVPESGYYQGTLRENNHISRLDFFTPTFDAMGYQILTRSELKDDFDLSDSRSVVSDKLKEGEEGFGFVPRYSEYKVGRNIVNGDLSLPSMVNSMSPYYLDKRYGVRYGYQDYSRNGAVGFYRFNFTEFPEVVSDTLRCFDGTDTLGNFNRIFNYTSNDIDHFIVQQVFDMQSYNGAKSLADSFDTFEDDNDTSTIDMVHQ